MSKYTRDGRRKAGNMGKDGYVSIFDDEDDFYEPKPRAYGYRDRDSRPFTGASCHESHPPLEIGGGVLLGGNCRTHTRHQGVDLYVALDSGQQHPYFDESMKLDTLPRCVYYPIQNLGVPNNAEKFHALIHIIVEALEQGQRVHVGCIGGHGRTGMVLAAVAAVLGVSDDPIAWVRENYCKKAVENSAQEGFLVVNFNCKMPKAKTKVDKPFAGF